MDSSNIHLYHPIQNCTEVEYTDGTMPSLNDTTNNQQTKTLDILAKLETNMEAQQVYSHKITEVLGGGLADEMRLKEGDKLIEFMGVSLKEMNHSHLIDTMTNINPTTLDILLCRETVNNNDHIPIPTEQYIRLKISIQITSSGDVTVHSEELDITQDFALTFDYIDGIMRVNGAIPIELKNIKTGNYLKLNGDKICLAPLTYDKNKVFFRFVCYTFSGMDEPNHCPTRIMMLCTLKEIFLQLQKSYKAHESSPVTLIRGKPPRKDVHRMEEDPRFFVVKPVEGAPSNLVHLVSFLNQDLYLSYDPSDKSRTNVCFKKLSNPSSDLDSQFQLFSLDQSKKCHIDRLVGAGNHTNIYKFGPDGHKEVSTKITTM
ncbi:unnamed protein product [Owenia fusiformis]|nr:unnamed protein product [Owenia fusiformis]